MRGYHGAWPNKADMIQERGRTLRSIVFQIGRIKDAMGRVQGWLVRRLGLAG